MGDLMKNSNIVKLALSSLFLSIGLFLPLLTSQIKEIGDTLLPMHIPIMLCGLICGIAGFLLVSVKNHSIHGSSTVNGRGFTAVLISWLAHFNPLAMVLTSFLVVFITTGSSEVGTYGRLGSSYPLVMTGIFFLCIIATEFFVSYKIVFKHPLNLGNGKLKMAAVSTKKYAIEDENASGNGSYDAAISQDSEEKANETETNETASCESSIDDRSNEEQKEEK